MIDGFLLSVRHQLLTVRSSLRFVVVVVVIQPAVLLLIVLDGGDRPDATRATTAAAAVLLTSFWNSTIWNGATILYRERVEGTLTALVRGVRDPRMILFGKMFGASVAPAVIITATVTVTLLGLRQPVEMTHPVWFSVGLLTLLVSGTALGTVLASIFMLTRYGAQLSSAIMYPVFLLAGLLVPSDLLPASVRWIGWLISLHWTQRFLAGAIAGPSDFAALGLAAALTAIYAVAGVVAFNRVTQRACDKGTLDLD